MQVKVHFTGLIRHYIREKEKAYELPEGARVGDLLLEVGREYGSLFPEQIWDASKERFHHTVIAIRKGSPAVDEGETLNPDDEIYILSRMAGG